MKLKTISGISLITLGIILSILSWSGLFGEGSGYLAIWIAFPLIIFGLLLLFSLVGATLFFIGEVLLILTVLTPASFVKTTGLIWVVYGLFIMGILYGVVEGIIKLVKIIKK